MNPLASHLSSLDSFYAPLIPSDDPEPSRPQAYSPRDYQISIFRKALKENLIVYLETGCGKTLIAVLLIRELASLRRQKNEKFSAIFLAPTVVLVKQQTEVLKINTDLQVENFYGAKGVDFWSASDWKLKVEENEVLVMTPAVLFDALCHSFLKMDDFELIVFDECHRAQKQDPYARIMREHYAKLGTRKPKIFGMTASPVVKKGVVSCEDSAKQIHLLECLLDSKIYTLGDRSELECHVSTPVQKCEWYELPKRSFDSVLQDLERMRDKYEKECTHNAENNSGYKDVQDKAKMLSKKIKKLHSALHFSLQNLGLWCASESVKCLLKGSECDVIYDGEEFSSEAQDFLKAASRVLDEAMQMEKFDSNVCSESIASIENGLITPKVQLLLKCLLRYKSKQDIRCIVFVERVITAMALAEVLSKIGCLSFIKCGCLTGSTVSLNTMGRKQQQCVLEEFRRGKVNVLVATDVAEEGIDIQSCSAVIRFDLPKNVRGFIQSRGRARMKSSDFIIFLEKDNREHSLMLESLMQSESFMKDETLHRKNLSVMVKKEPVEAVDLLHVESTGATITSHSSIKLIYYYCSKLPKDEFYKPEPEFIIEMIDHGEVTGYVCQLIMPVNCPFRELKSSPKHSISHAKQSVCLEACKKLYSMGQLTDHLVPVISVDESEENIPRKNKTGAGTTKRKELHATTRTEAFAGNWINESGEIALHMYLLCFTSLEEDDQYTELALLFDAVIDDDILQVEIPLYLKKNKTVVARIYAAGTYTLNADQLKQAKAYQQLIFNGMFGKLVRRQEGQSKLQNWILSGSQLDETWTLLHMYLLLPLTPGNHLEELDALPVDWEAVKNCSIAARMLSEIHPTVGSSQNQMTCVDLVETGHCGGDVVHMACDTRPYHTVRGMAVITIHTGRIYSVVDVLEGKNADCPMESAESTEEWNYSCYTHYFAEKYGVVLKYPQQPLFQVKQTHRLYNLLRKNTDDPNKVKKQDETQRNKLVEMPPELCLWIGITSELVHSMYLFPSVLHRFNALISAGQLRRTIAKEMPDCYIIPPAHLLEALTTERCLEGFSHEGLELLGDSFLKFVVSQYLYLVYDKHHEGQLTTRRSRLICNENLHNLAVKKGLSGYIRDEPFHSDCWCAPGLLCIRSVPCTCNIGDLTNFQDGDWKGQGKTKGVFKIGKSCRRGHRWICSKTISDTVEALIGAFIVSGGVGPAVKFMKWIGIDVDPDKSFYEEARNRCVVHANVINGINIKNLESCLDYEFCNKSLLVEALTHASYHDLHGGYCYQRLEYLGDAVLDYLVTRHLFLSHPGLSPGILSDLRSAAVNNECFSRASVKYNLQRYFRHGSSELLNRITNFVRNTTGHDHVFGWEVVHGPKVLGDIFESIAGAVLVDSGFDLDIVWSVVKPLLSPLVTPSTLPLHPIRELCELSHFRHIPYEWKIGRSSTQVLATIKIEIENETFEKTGTGRDKKIAKKHAAQQALLFLASKGKFHPRRPHHGSDTEIRDKSSKICEVTTQICEKHASGSDLEDKENAGPGKCSHSGQVETFNESKRKYSISCPVTSDAEDSKMPRSGNCELRSEDSDSSDEKRRKLSECASITKSDSSGITQRNAFPSDSKQEYGKDLMDSICRAENIFYSENTKSTNVHDMDMNTGVDVICNTESKVLSNGEEKLISANSSVLYSKATISVKEQNSISNVKRIDSIMGNGHSMTVTESLSMEIAELKKELRLRISEKGCGRSLLNEFCVKHKWAGPEYEPVSSENQSLFTFSASINGPSGVMKCTGDPRPRKNDAKESAALKVLMTLTKGY